LLYQSAAPPTRAPMRVGVAVSERDRFSVC